MRRIILYCTFILFFTGCFHIKDRKNAENIIEGLNIGNKAPELVYSDPDGVRIALSSIQGKIVLIDFWASWCPPCRIENPKLVKVYNYFKDQKFENGDGFTVYSFSCDKTKEAWVHAIIADSLTWKNHVSELKGWESEATYTYKISSIPSSILIDGNGVILAKDLNAESLFNFLKGILAQ